MPRRSEIDVLRVAAMISVFAAHAAQPFNPWDTWHVQSPERSRWLGELVLFLAPWVMPLFVLLAGASAWHSLGKRSAREYLNERVTRLIVPLAAGILLLVPPQVYLDRRQHGLFDGSFLAFYPHFFERLYPRGNFTLSHLWFLAVLALLALITLPLFQWLREAPGRRAMARLGTICAPPGAILLLVLPMIAIRAALSMIFPQSRPIVVDWSNRTTLLAMFVSGYVLAGEPALMSAVDRQWKLALGVAVVFSAAMSVWAWPGTFIERLPVPFSASFALLWSIYALGGLAWSLALLGAVRTLRGGPSHRLDRVRELLNPFYILHQTVIVVFAFLLIGTGANPIAMYVVLFVSAFAATAALGTLAKRWRVTRILFGVRAARAGADEDSPMTPTLLSNASPALLTPSPAVRARADYQPNVRTEGSGPAIVLVPGMDGTGRLFYRQVPLLARGFRVATYALRDDALDMDTLVEDLGAVVRGVSSNGEPAVIVGESFGGTLAMSFAVAHPELVRALVVLNSFPHFRPQYRLRLAIAGLGVMPWGAMRLVRRLTAFRLHSRYTHREELERFLHEVAYTTRDGYLSRLRILRRYDVRARLADIAAPTLFIAAEHDHLVPSVEQASYMVERVPRARLHILRGHGHICLIAPNMDLGAIIADWGLDAAEAKASASI